MTAGKLIPFEVALKREDQRLIERKAREDRARRKLMPLVVIVCETFRVSTEDLLDSYNKHPTVMMARDVIRWLGYNKLHVGMAHLAIILNQRRKGAVPNVTRIKKKLEDVPEFKRQMECIEALFDAQVQK